MTRRVRTQVAQTRSSDGEPLFLPAAPSAHPYPPQLEGLSQTHEPGWPRDHLHRHTLNPNPHLFQCTLPLKNWWNMRMRWGRGRARQTHVPRAMVMQTEVLAMGALRLREQEEGGARPSRPAYASSTFLNSPIPTSSCRYPYSGSAYRSAFSTTDILSHDGTGVFACCVALETGSNAPTSSVDKPLANSSV